MQRAKIDTSVSVLGLGLMGRPMARTLIAAGFDVRGWNRSELDEQTVEGIPLCGDLAEAAQSDVLLLMLADSAAVDSVLAQLELHLSEGRIVLDMGSSEPARSAEHATRLDAKGIGWVDAPVSGGPGSAAEGSLAVMAGGNEEDFAHVKPLLEALGSNVVRVGGPGAGHTAKVANQIIVSLMIEAVAEAFALAERAGLDLRIVQEALRGGTAHSRVLDIQGSRMIERDYAPAGRVATILKDLRVALALASELDADLPNTASTAAMYEQLVARGDGELDASAVYELRVDDA